MDSARYSTNVMKKIIILVSIIILLISCGKKEIPETFPVLPIEIGVAVDIPEQPQIGFVNPSYYIGKQRKVSAAALILSVQPKEYLLAQIESDIKSRFTGTKITVAKILLKDIPYLPETYTGPDVRKPVISPPVDLQKLKELLGTRYIALIRIRLLRIELDARPGVPDLMIIDPVFALYETDHTQPVYLWYLGTPGGITTSEIKINLGNHEDNESNRALLKKSLEQLVKKSLDELTEKLVKRFSQ